LPEYVVTEKNVIMESDYYLQFIEGDNYDENKNYLLFNMEAVDDLLKEEFSNMGANILESNDCLDDYINILKKLKTQTIDKLFKSIAYSQYIVVGLEYIMDYCDGCDLNVHILGYFDRDLSFVLRVYASGGLVVYSTFVILIIFCGIIKFSASNRHLTYTLKPL